MTKRLIAADLFCGAGGTSTGLALACESAGRKLDLTAVNHNETAIATHSANHPGAKHLCHGLDDVDPRKVMGKRLDLLVASPECTHHSGARGGKPMQDQSRATAWHVVRWADALRPQYILVENVREFLTWGPLGTNGRPLKKRKGETFQAWLQAIRSLGYTVDWRLLNAADYGDATSRVRLFVLARRGNGRLPWPEPTHAKQATADLFGSRSRWRAAREVIDWSIPCPSIFGRKRPLSPNTLARIEAGLRRFGGAAAEPFIVALRGTSGSQLPYTSRGIGDPIPTVSAGGTHVGLVQPFILDQHSSHGPRSADDPAPTITTTSRGIGVVQPFVLGQQSGAAARSLGDPLPTGATDGAIAFIVPTNYGEREGQAPRTHDIDQPTPTILGSVTHGLCQPFLVRYNGTSGPQPTDAPMSTLDTNDRLGLVAPDQVRIDIGFRMLQPSELAAAMGFPAGYQFVGNREQVVRQVGNAVPVNLSYALTRSILEAA